MVTPLPLHPGLELDGLVDLQSMHEGADPHLDIFGLSHLNNMLKSIRK